MGVYTSVHVLAEVRGIGSLQNWNEITFHLESGEPPDNDTGSQTQVLYKNSICSLTAEPSLQLLIFFLNLLMVASDSHLS